jgi:hypothetical protein
MTRFIALVAIACLALAGCSDDSERPKVTNSPYENLTERSHVLTNLVESYNRMNADRYVELLDGEFVSYFYAGDVGKNGIPTDWGVEAEKASAREMLGGGGGRDDNPVLAIDFRLVGLGDATWESYEPQGYPGETWHRTTLQYDYLVDTSKDIQWITSGIPTATLVVREQPDGTWRLVECRDHYNGLRTNTSAAATEETTWGVLKALYHLE